MFYVWFITAFTGAHPNLCITFCNTVMGAARSSNIGIVLQHYTTLWPRRLRLEWYEMLYRGTGRLL